jgi:hypothetical protein
MKMNLATRQRFERAGNNSNAWRASVVPLLAAADALRDASNPSKTSSPRPDGLIHGPEMILRGFAVECLLKGLWVKHGNAIATQGKYIGVQRVKDHDLVGLANVVRQPLTSDQRHVLELLSVYITTVGRYPIPKHAEQLRIVRWRVPQDTATLDALVADLSAQLRA